MGKKVLSGVAALAMMLTGCGGQTEGGQEAPPADGGTYASVAELKDAMVDAGLNCPDWEEHDSNPLTEGAGTCSDELILATYDDEDDMAFQIETWETIGDMIEFEILIGQNWTISGPGSAELDESLGGNVFRTEGKG